jgi:hypothetical protein
MSQTKTRKVSESKICRDVIDRHEVLQAQVLNLVLEHVGDSLEKESLQKLKNNLKGTFNTQTQGLLTQISRQFQVK